jgi:hypothetical protein
MNKSEREKNHARNRVTATLCGSPGRTVDLDQLKLWATELKQDFIWLSDLLFELQSDQLLIPVDPINMPQSVAANGAIAVSYVQNPVWRITTEPIEVLRWAE